MDDFVSGVSNGVTNISFTPITDGNKNVMKKDRTKDRTKPVRVQVRPHSSMFTEDFLVLLIVFCTDFLVIFAVASYSLLS